MRMSTQAVRSPPKNPMSAASKITKVVTEFFLPLADGFVPEYTPLTATPDDDEAILLEMIWEAFPECMRTKEEFVARMGELYDSGRQRDASSEGGKRDASSEGGNASQIEAFKTSHGEVFPHAKKIKTSDPPPGDLCGKTSPPPGETSEAPESQ